MIWAVATVLAQDAVDTTLLDTPLGDRALAGIETPPGEPGWTVAASLHVEDDPLQVHLGEERYAVIDDRLVVGVGAGWTAGRWMLRAGLTGAQATEALDSPLAVDAGWHLGNPSLGLMMRVLERERWATALRADFLLPMPEVDWLRESAPRQTLTVVTTYRDAQVQWSSELGIHRRTVAHDTLYQWTPGTQFVARTGAAFEVVDGVAVTASLVYRGQMLRGPEESSLEGLVGVRLMGASVIGAGRGLTHGVGTTRVRGFAQVSLTPEARERIRNRGEEPEPEVAQVVEAAPQDPRSDDYYSTNHTLQTPGASSHRQVSDEPEPPPEGPPPLARIEDDRIVISEPIRFEQGTDVILAESLPVLDAVAQLIADNPRIVHVAIVGHASVEGEHGPNYDLSTLRAQSVYEQLLLNGVHPHRLSYRGMGEVEPLDELAASRRVEFVIVNQLHPLDDPPPLSSSAPLPWNGQEVLVRQPPPPELPEAPPDPYPDLDTGDFELDDELSEDAPDDLPADLPADLPEGTPQEAP